MEHVVPRGALIEVIESHYPKSSSKSGRSPYSLARMLRIHLMQQWDSLSDSAMEDALIEMPTMRRFAGIDILSDRSPDETTILALRHLLEKYSLRERIYETVKAHLKERRMAMKQVSIIDASLIAAPSSTNNKDSKRKQGMHQTKKGSKWFFGMKINAGVGKDTGLIHSVVTTAGNIHDLTPAAELLHGQEAMVYADSGSQGIAKRKEMAGKVAKFQVGMQPGKRRALPGAEGLGLDDAPFSSPERLLSLGSGQSWRRLWRGFYQSMRARPPRHSPTSLLNHLP